MTTASASSTEAVRAYGEFRPLPTQLAFASSPYRLKAYIGSVGSGKSEILCRVCVELSAFAPGSRGVIGRYTHKDFRRTTQETLERVLPRELVEREIPGGEGWILRTCDPDKPATLWTAHYDEPGAYASMGLLYFAIDEVNGDDLTPSVPERVFNMLDARLGRDQDPERKPYGLLGGNPAGHNWVWRLFHPESPTRLPDAMMFTPSPFENASNLPRNYYDGLISRNGPEWVARYVLGKHDVFEGQVYAELDDRKHGEDPFPIPPQWPRVIALDHGLRAPTAVLFIAVDNDGGLHVYDEHYEAERPVSYHAKKIGERVLGMGRAKAISWIADPSIFAKSMQTAGKVFSVADEYADCALDQWEPGENDVAAGRNRIKELLKTGKLHFVRGRVPNLWREMQQLHWRRVRTVDRDAPEEEADIDNHSVDALRYAVMSRPEPAEQKVAAKKDKVLTESEQRIIRAHRHIQQAVQRHRSAFRKDGGGYV